MVGRRRQPAAVGHGGDGNDGAVELALVHVLDGSVGGVGAVVVDVRNPAMCRRRAQLSGGGNIDVLDAAIRTEYLVQMLARHVARQSLNHDLQRAQTHQSAKHKAWSARERGTLSHLCAPAHGARLPARAPRPAVCRPRRALPAQAAAAMSAAAVRRVPDTARATVGPFLLAPGRQATDRGALGGARARH